MIKINCDLEVFMSENIPLGDNKEEANELMPPKEPESQKELELVAEE